MITTGDESVRGGQGGSKNSGLSYSSGGCTGGIFPACANPTWGKQGSRDATGGEQGGNAGAKRGSQARKKRSGAEGCSLRGVGAGLVAGRGLAESRGQGEPRGEGSPRTPRRRIPSRNEAAARAPSPCFRPLPTCLMLRLGGDKIPLGNVSARPRCAHGGAATRPVTRAPHGMKTSVR